MTAKILVVDDDSSIREIIEALLQRQGHDVTTCTSAKQALEVVETHAFDLVITDLVMPEVGGVELVNHLTRNSDTKVLVVSGSERDGNEGHLEFAERQGAARVMEKPFAGDDLIAAVTELLA